MAINPNTDFTSGAVLTADQMNRLPRGVMARGVSSADYTLTTTLAQATGMSVTFTAVANRYYLVTYYEAQAQTPSVLGNTTIELRQTNATGTQLAQAVLVNETAAIDQGNLMIVKTLTFTAGSVTLVGCAKTSSTTGGPSLIRSGNREALLLVEDIGPA
ncbi:MAG: hypothetical protein EBV32_06340 [Proteobacteria bacterium]|uniref:Uncharacterized protein n=1 Tax=Candidatus Fonsibacter lacus TaxID=2576439 RepID=A0A964V5U2_9PROT|nr:hypothetical protein [Candidatus Fonsibacter lacus]